MDIFLEIGPTGAGGFGPSPLTFSEIRAWEECIGIRLEPWESRMIRRLSIAYCAESSVCDDADYPAPFDDAPTVVEKLNIAAKLRGAIRATAQ